MNKACYHLAICVIINLFLTNYSWSKGNADSWNEVQKKNSGIITVYYRDTEPFIIANNKGELSGIEYDLLQNFKDFIEDYYGYKLEIKWERKDRFSIVYNAIKEEQINGTFAISIISNTEERQKEVSFSPSYMHDINVLVSSDNVKTVNSIAEYNVVFDKLSAITILETTYEKQLNLIRDKYENNFPIIYVENTDNVLQTLSSNDNFFGYLDLPNYLLALNNDSKIKRQNVFSFKNIGYGIIYPLESDWGEPLRAYFNNPNFNQFMKSTSEKYLGEEVYEFMQTMADSNNESLMLLAREKELQDKELSKNELILNEQRAIRNLFIIGFLSTIVIVLILFRQYKSKVKSNIALNKQQQKIEKQSKKLESTNAKLITLNEEKNNLINILSHDLRAPSNNIQGLATMLQLQLKELPEAQAKIISHIKSEAQRLNLMIEKILDIRRIENQQINISISKIDFESITNDVIKNFNDRAKDKNIELVFKNEASSQFILADEIYLIQVIENIISNAIKFSEGNSSVQLIIKEIQGKLILTVSDQGPGISDQDMKKMFGKFQRLTAKPTSGESSTGLGLSIVKKYMTEMNGNVWCESELGIGSKFFLEFEKYQG